MTIKTDDVRDLLGREVYDAHGDKVGKVGQVYLDSQTSAPVWATVKTGLFGTKESFVPLAGATRAGRDLHVNTSKDTIKNAPQAGGNDGRLSRAEEQQIYAHYGHSHPDAAPGAGAARGHDTASDTTKHARAEGDSVTRSEERLRAGTETVETGQVRLRKYVVTEEQQVTVPVSREEVRVEREPIRDGNARQGSDIGEEEQSVTLHAERPIVTKETEAVERVRLQTDTVRDQETVSGQVRKEHVEIDDPDGQIRTQRSRQDHR
ncbi:PRC and DUF2382 domain-containing protein [Pseudonocardia acidicola]|uniref:PRC and DUF2382 domain-containing protein n=1 Tax=Pseudonocardia acidicola TaxID=2724939 RepID=UPI00308440AD